MVIIVIPVLSDFHHHHHHHQPPKHELYGGGNRRQSKESKRFDNNFEVQRMVVGVGRRKGMSKELVLAKGRSINLSLRWNHSVV